MLALYLGILFVCLGYHIFIYKFIRRLWRKTNAYQAATEAKSKFLANMSHEIRTPLNAIIGMGELLESAQLSSEEQKYLKILQSASANLLALINDILDISKIEAGKIELEEILFCPKTLIHDTVRFLAPSAQDKNLDIFCNIEDDLPLCEGDPVRIRQILVNLVSNAVKFTNEGYIQINASVCTKEILVSKSITASKDSDTFHLLLSIKDTGIGIPMQKWENIFDTFTQADPSTTRRFGGSGLGLAITRRIIELMGGRIWVESFENSGSIFYCLLPFGAVPSTVIKKSENLKHAQKHIKKTQQIQKNAPNVPAVKPLKILLVEDNPDNQVLFEAYLKQTSHQLQIANNGQEALNSVYEKKFDLVFMDIQMPVLDGIKATRHIRKWEEKQIKQGESKGRMPIYALTAHALKNEIENTTAAGCDGHITKPLKKSELLHVIERHAA